MDNRIKRIAVLISLCLAPTALYPFRAQAQEAQFDMDILKSRGLDASLGDYFADSPKFMPGRQPVTLIVNGEEKGNVTARFGKNGELCVDRAFLQSAGLKVPSALKGDETDESPCYDYKNDYPTAQITASSGEEKLSLVVPQEALTNDLMLPGNVAHGGTAALVNYSLMSSQSSYSGAKNRYDQLSLEDGVNIHDWLLRSRQMMTRIDGKTNNDALYTYVQHTFEKSKTLMQAGQINISNTLFSGASINGLQFIPESELMSHAGSGVVVTGIASSPQARVEVKQGGRLIYSTLVPAGPFTLDDVPVTSLNTALDVSVTETNGAQSRYTIPADALRSGLAGPQGLSMALGRTQDKANNGRQPWLATFSDGWRLRPWLNASAGAMAAQDYHALAAQFDMQLRKDIMVSTALHGSHDADGGNSGHSANVNISYSATKNLGFSASATRYSAGYRELTDTLDDDFTQYSGQYSASASWSDPLLGAFSLGYSLNEGTGGDNDSRYLSASWGKSFRWASVSVNWQRLLNRSDDNDYRNNSNYGGMLYVNVSVPLGKQRVSGYMHKRGDETRSGLSTSGDIGRNSYYSLSTEHSNQDGDNSFDGSINSNLHYTQLGLSAGVDGSQSRNSSMTLNGGVVAHGSGVTFSPYAVQDTYAIASIDDAVSGIEINTPDGPVWTDHWGRAVVPSLPAYKAARVEMNTDTLPKNIDVNNGISVLAAGHGSVSDVNFSVLNVRRVMLNITMPNGRLLPKNASLVDGEGNYVTTAVDEGLVFLNDAEQVKELLVVDDEGKRQCRVIYQLAKKRDVNKLYEQTKGVCQ
ncbi:fimbrial biogenesis usher protein [Cronobacter dublinensis]|uniref:fimbrial biogenesis usher protein n=1 Tax=Cronobacter dublinensis TaxID=413497 RepID=UPI0024A8A5C9|nr:fimbrial biogenesis usher protein [Cronobacter dublinensis]MDI6426471.1 fimbrial biogenesis usher protein [Cronobacter dublinensis]